MCGVDWGQYLKVVWGVQDDSTELGQSHAPCPASCLGQEQAGGLETTKGAQQHPGTQAASVSLCKLSGYLQQCWDRVTFRG